MYDSDNELMPQVFAVDSTEAELNFEAPPTSGQEYLRRVILEAKTIPPVVVADIDSNMINRSQPTTLHMCSSLHPAPDGYAPSLAWQTQQAAEFSDVRQRFAKFKAKIKKEKIKSKYKIPFKEDVDAWCKLCFGCLNVKRNWKRNLDSVPFQTDVLPSNDDGTHGTPPYLSIVAYMDQPCIVQVLEYHVNWFEATGFTARQGQWFYALLACLEKPLDPEACALLRSLARNCASLRATLDSADDERLCSLNLIICLVARYFQQSDLGDIN